VSSRLTGSVAALVAVSAWGASFVATRIALETLSPVVLVAWRLVTATLLLAWVARLAPGRVRGAGWRELAPVGLLGVVFALHLLIQAWGLEHTTAVHTGWIIGAMPAAIALGARLVYGQKLTRTGWFGLGIAFAGVAAVVWHHPPGLRTARFGDLLQISSIATWTVYTLAAVRPVARWGSLTVTAGSMAVAAAVITPVAMTVGGGAWVPPDGRTWIAVLFLGLVAGGIAQLLWLRSLAEIGAARTAVWLYLEPFVTVAVARALLTEPVGAGAVAGGLVTLAGVAVVQASRGTRPRTRSAQPVSRR
jgi:drug/metabolite transporter (DMT)-like permease